MGARYSVYITGERMSIDFQLNDKEDLKFLQTLLIKIVEPNLKATTKNEESQK